MASKEIAIIGVGRFGSGVVEKIVNLPHYDIIAIDNSESHLKEFDNLSKYYVGDASDEKFLISLGLDSVDIFVVGIGDNVQASLLIASIIKSNWPSARIIAKAVNLHHEKILQQIGVREIVNPERAASRRAAMKIVNPLAGNLASENEEVFELDVGISLVKIHTLPWMINKRVSDFDIPKGISLVLVYKNGQAETVSGDTIIEEEDEVVIIGENTKIMKLLQKINESK